MSLSEYLEAPPYSLDAEQATLGAALIKMQAAEYVAGALDAADFYYQPNRHVFAAIVSLILDPRRAVPPDTFTVPDLLLQRGQLDQCGGVAYINSLVDSVPTAAHVEHYAGRVADLAAKRRLLEASGEILALSRDTELSAEEAQGRAEEIVLDAGGRARREMLWTPADTGIYGAYERAVTPGEREAGVLSGFSAIDHITGGWQRSDLILMAARPGVGKTSLLLQFATAAAGEVPVAIFSLEMSERQLWDRMLCGTARVDLMRLRAGMLTDECRRRLARSADDLRALPIRVNDRSELSIQQMRAEARRLARDGVRLFLVDYVQRVRIGDRERPENRNQELASIARSLKSMARETDTPVIAVSSLKRPGQAGEKEPPRLTALRDSGELDYEADVVVMLHRPSLAAGERENLPMVDETHVIFEKHRNGPLGVAKIAFLPRYACFEELDQHHEEPPPHADTDWTR